MTKRILAFVLAICLTAAFGLTARGASTLDEAKAEQKRLQNEKKSLEQQKKQVSQNLINNKQVRDSIIAE